MWQQLKLRSEAANSAALEEELFELGALAVTLLDAEDQPLFQQEPGSAPLWDETILLCLFDGALDLTATLTRLKADHRVKNAASLAVESIEDQQWETSWMADYQPMQVGANLWICPSWLDPPQPQAVNLVLDPGLAFGSGAHATTALCLDWLDQAPPQGLEVIDYGCGSGVLGIAAALLGARRVYAVDHDPQAISATGANAQRNRIEPSRLTALLPEHLPPLQADLVLANILAQPLLELSARFSQLVKPGGSIVLSGLLQEQASAIDECYRQWFTMAPPSSREGWVLLSGVRRS